jgi:hypothetical protein
MNITGRLNYAKIKTYIIFKIKFFKNKIFFQFYFYFLVNIYSYRTIYLRPTNKVNFTPIHEKYVEYEFFVDKWIEEYRKRGRLVVGEAKVRI